MRTTIHVFGSKRSGCSKAFTYSYLRIVSIRQYWFSRKIILLRVCHLKVVRVSVRGLRRKVKRGC
jgi:hypothetical protein